MLRVLAVGSVVATFLSLFGPFDVPFAAIAVRDAQYFAYSWIGSLLGLASVRIAWRLGLWPRGFAVVGAVAGLIMAAPMTLAVWLGELLASGHPAPIKALPT
ncbi:MAG: hypothetical protein JWP86_666, partial [Phenylobacterium sp.]|nr:hypothetical protein [Phenylobacterium sp.]